MLDRVVIGGVKPANVADEDLAEAQACSASTRNLGGEDGFCFWFGCSVELLWQNSNLCLARRNKVPQ